MLWKKCKNHDYLGKTILKGEKTLRDILEDVKWIMLEKESLLSKNACKSNESIRLENDKKDIRPEFFRDIDRIIHSQGYTRYIDKTQVYSFTDNDHITHRVLHVQLVSKIARTIGRALSLNEDLIEAIALGHDIGHTPFGHTGEKFLNDICKKNNMGYFTHNAQSVRILKDIENLNISIQTLDGILAHNGEMIINKYEPNKEKTTEQLLEELSLTFTKENYSKKIKAMTLEGCVVRISDIIAYVGRDIEDAIMLGVINREDLPKRIVDVLGDNNSSIVNTLILDIIQNSIDQNYIKMSKDVFYALMSLKEWNYRNIYNSPEACKNRTELKEAFESLFEVYYEKLKDKNLHNKIEISNWMPYSEKMLYDFVNSRTEEYIKKTDLKRIIIDYIAGETDKFFLRECLSNLDMRFA
jgi:dGTPase